MATPLPYSQAVDIGGGRGRLAAQAAASLARVDEQIGHLLDINEAWRSPEQADANYRAYQSYLNGGSWAPIAFPADQSIHCIGYAIDTDEQLVAILNDHGWFQTVYRNGVLVEPWHFEYDASRDQYRGTGFPSGWMGQPFEQTKRGDDDMSIQIRNTKTGLIAQVAPDYFAAMPDMATADIVRNVSSSSDERHELDEVAFYRVTDSFGIPRTAVKAGSYWSRGSANQQAIAALQKSVDALAAKR